jgi:hypothetical protein
MLRKPKYFDTPSLAREALKRALHERSIKHDVVEIRVKTDPEDEKWFGIVSLDIDTAGSLDQSRRLLPEFRVIAAP